MANDNEQLNYAGQVIIEQLDLVSADNCHRVNLLGLMAEFSLFEDMFAPSMHGMITITENFNLITNFPIIGEETIIFKAHTPMHEKQINKTFTVVKVSDRVFDSVKKQTYVIRFISETGSVDLTKKLYRAYTGTPSDCALAIFNECFPNQTLNTTNSSNLIKYVAPTISPFKAISTLANKAFDESELGMGNFVFYEDNQQFNFVSLSSLFEKQPEYTFKYSASQLRGKLDDGESVKDFEEEYSNVKEFEIVTSVDTLERRMSSAYGHKVIEVDVLRKTANALQYDLKTDYKKHKHLNDTPVFTDNIISSPESSVEPCVTYALSHTVIKNDRDALVLLKRTVSLAQSQMIKIRLVCHGRSSIKVGDIVNFMIPSAETEDETDQYKGTKLDPHYSGKYMITAIQHRFTMSKHETIMMLTKDSFTNAVEFDNMKKD